MKKLLIVLFCSLFVLQGCNNTLFDLTPYIMLQENTPAMKNGMIEPMKVDVTFDYETLQKDYINGGNIYVKELEQVINKIQFTVNNTPVENYDWSDSKFVIKPSNRKDLKQYGFKIDRKIKLNDESDQYQQILSSYKGKTNEQLQYDEDEKFSYDIGLKIADKTLEFNSNVIALENGDIELSSYHSNINFYLNNEYFENDNTHSNEQYPLYTMTNFDKEITNEHTIYYIAKENVNFNNVDIEYTCYITDEMGTIFTIGIPVSSLGGSLENDKTGSKIYSVDDYTSADESISNYLIKTGAIFTWFDSSITINDVESYINEFTDVINNIYDVQTSYSSKNTIEIQDSVLSEFELQFRDIANPIIGRVEGGFYNTIYSPNGIFYRYVKSAMFDAIVNNPESKEHKDKYSQIGDIPLD